MKSELFAHNELEKKIKNIPNFDKAKSIVMSLVII